MMLFLLLTCVTSVLGQGPVTLTYFNLWKTGFQGTFTVSPNADIIAWKATFTFDGPTDSLEIWTADITSSAPDGTSYVVESKDYSGNVLAGQTETIYWLARYSTNIPPSGTVLVEFDDGTIPIPTPPIAVVDPGQVVPPVARTRFDYQQALNLSLLFYYAQRSGDLPDSNPIPWRGDSALTDSDNGRDLSGGWYDAGDHVKFNFPMAYSTWVLEWGLLKFRDAYANAGEMAAVCDTLRWPLDYFLRSWFPFSQTLYVQVGDGYIDHTYWGRPEDMNMERPVFQIDRRCPGSDVAAATAAAFAAGSMVFKDVCGRPLFARQLLRNAKSLYSFAKNNRGLYSQCVNQAAVFYGSTSDADDLAVAASFLYMATGQSSYLTDAQTFHESGTRWALSWDDTMVAADLLLYEITQDAIYKNDVTNFVDSYMPGGSVPQTPCGLAYRDSWGANRYAANAAFIALVAAEENINPTSYISWAMSQIHYILGDNKDQRSYEIGYGLSYPERPHHRGSACAENTTCSIMDPGPNPNILKGALVGGPDSQDNFVDDRNNYIQNEVTCDYNAGFQGALAGLLHFNLLGALPAANSSTC